MKRIFTFLLIFICSYSVFSQTPKWELKVGGGGLGNPFGYNPKNRDIIYCSPASNTIWISRDRGDTWSQFSVLSGGNQITSIVVNPVDTNIILVGQKGNPNDFVKRTTNNGQTWTTIGNFNFSYFGVPLEWIEEYPDLVYAMDGTNFRCSTDFGATWRTMSSTSGLFNEMCDMAIRPDSAGVVYLGDNGYGIWKTIDSGKTWHRKYDATSGEVPLMIIDHSKPWIAYGTKYSGGGGMVKTTDYGETWHLLSTPFSGSNTWGVVTSSINTNYVYMGTYGGSSTVAGIWVSKDEGNNWERLSIDGLGSKSNYGLLVVDTLSVMALQGDGIYKYKFNIFSVRNVEARFSVDTRHGIDFHNDMPINLIDKVFLKGDLPIIGANGGNWTFSDTSNSTVVQLYDDGTHGDETANDKKWTRDIIIPAGTMKGTFHYKYGASYSGVDTVNNGFQYLNNESESSFSHQNIFTDAETTVVYNTDRWHTLGISQEAEAIFSINVAGGADVHNGRSISNPDAVWIKGSLLPLGHLRGNWTFNDTTEKNIFQLYNDGTHGDSLAGDKVWTTTMLFPEDTRIGGFQYRYGASYTGIDTVNSGIQYLNNEITQNGTSHLAILTDGISTIKYATDVWRTLQNGILSISDDSISLTVHESDSLSHSFMLSNAVEFGGQNVQFRIGVEDFDYDSTLSIGGMDTTTQGREKGDIYHISDFTTLREINVYVQSSNSYSMYFFVYEASGRTSPYKKIFQQNVTQSAGSGWKSSGPIRVYLKKGKYYYIGTSWPTSSIVTFRRNIMSDSLRLPCGTALQGQSANNIASYPPKDSLSGTTFSNPNGFYYQELVTNTIPYLSLSKYDGTLSPQQSTEISLIVTGSRTSLGNHSAQLVIETSETNHQTRIVPVTVNVTPLSVSEINQVPMLFSLSQNYPNPFNPFTVISYDLFTEGIVTVKVYDILGNEVSSIVNERQQSGKYQVGWDAAGFPSGIYFYRLDLKQNGKSRYSETKKLLLMK